MYGRNLKSGHACTVEMYKETLPILGKWKTVSLSGAKEMFKLLGNTVCILIDSNIEFNQTRTIRPIGYSIIRVAKAVADYYSLLTQ